jgi:serine protease Do
MRRLVLSHRTVSSLLACDALLARGRQSAVRVLAHTRVGKTTDRREERPSRSRPLILTSIGLGVRFGVANRVLTAASVIAHADSIEVQVGRRKMPAELLGVDAVSQLALLSVNELLTSNEPPQATVHPATQGDVIVMVDMLGEQPNLHVGSVTEIHPSGRIVTSLAVYPGLSGAPLFNDRGEVVGVLAFASDERSNKTGAGDAIGIPADLVAHIASELEAFGRVRRGYFGAGVEELNRDRIILADVQPDGPAGLSGLRDGDVVTRYGGEDLDDSEHLRDLVKATVPGTAVPVEAYRDTVQLTVSVVIGDGTAELATQEAVIGQSQMSVDLEALARWRALIDEFEALLVLPEFDPGRPDVRTRLVRFERELQDLKQTTGAVPPRLP